MVVRGDRLGKSMSAYLVDRIGAHPLIDVRLHTQVEGVEEEGGELARVCIRDAGGSAEVSQGVIDDNEQARLGGLRTALAALALIALLALFFSARIPTEQLGSKRPSTREAPDAATT